MTSTLSGDTGVSLHQKPRVRELIEVIAALDRRVPRVDRASEAAIARDAAALRSRALQRVAELEAEPAATELG